MDKLPPEFIVSGILFYIVLAWAHFKLGVQVERDRWKKRVVTLPSKLHKVTCDSCGTTEFYAGSEESVVQQIRNNGWRITFDKMTFCCVACYREPTIPQ